MGPLLRATRTRWPAVLVAAGSLVAAAAGAAVGTPTGPSGGASAHSPRQVWPSGGQNAYDTRYNPGERTISPANVADLEVAWTQTVHGDVSATPAVVDGAVYVPDWGGYLTKFDAETGRVLWSHPVSDYDGIPGSIARTSPAVSHGLVYIADQNATTSPVAGGLGAHLMAVDAETGQPVWDTVVDDHYTAFVTQSPLVWHGRVYIGVSSREEAVSTVSSYACCTFRGSVVALDARTGRVVWKAYTVPDNGGRPGGYSGGAIWSGTPAIEPRLHLLYVTTGNNYTVPQSVTDCQDAGGTAEECSSPDNHIDSIMALDLRTGTVRWATGGKEFDAWVTACLPVYANHNCPKNVGPDADFADGAHVVHTRTPDGHPRTLVTAGQKSGLYWAVDAATGAIVWSTSVGPGGLQGGVMWGSAADGQRIYVAEADDADVPYQTYGGETITSGSFLALDPVDGHVLWQTPDPSGGEDKAPLSVANGVVYAGSMTGHMYAVDAATGRIAWDHLGAGSSVAGPAVGGGMVFWGNGYARFGVGTPSTTFYAFRLSSDRHPG